VELVNRQFFNEFTLRLAKPSRQVVRDMAAKSVLGGVSLGRLYPGGRGAGERAADRPSPRRSNPMTNRAGKGAGRGTGMSVNASGWTPAHRSDEGEAQTWTGQPGADAREALHLRDGLRERQRC
jgi:hypothetical protein